MVAVAVDLYPKNINSDRGDLGAILRAAWRSLGGFWEVCENRPNEFQALELIWYSIGRVLVTPFRRLGDGFLEV